MDAINNLHSHAADSVLSLVQAIDGEIALLSKDLADFGKAVELGLLRKDVLKAHALLTSAPVAEKGAVPSPHDDAVSSAAATPASRTSAAASARRHQRQQNANSNRHGRLHSPPHQVRKVAGSRDLRHLDNMAMTMDGTVDVPDVLREPRQVGERFMGDSTMTWIENAEEEARALLEGGGGAKSDAETVMSETVKHRLAVGGGGGGEPRNMKSSPAPQPTPPYRFRGRPVNTKAPPKTSRGTKLSVGASRSAATTASRWTQAWEVVPGALHSWATEQLEMMFRHLLAELQGRRRHRGEPEVPRG